MKLRTLFAAILLSSSALAEEPKVIVEVDNFNLKLNCLTNWLIPSFYLTQQKAKH